MTIFDRIAVLQTDVFGPRLPTSHAASAFPAGRPLMFGLKAESFRLRAGSFQFARVEEAYAALSA
jgi:hypothetical protein